MLKAKKGFYHFRLGTVKRGQELVDLNENLARELEPFLTEVKEKEEDTAPKKSRSKKTEDE